MNTCSCVMPITRRSVSCFPNIKKIFVTMEVICQPYIIIKGSSRDIDLRRSFISTWPRFRRSLSHVFDKLYHNELVQFNEFWKSISNGYDNFFNFFYSECLHFGIIELSIYILKSLRMIFHAVNSLAPVYTGQHDGASLRH